MPVSETYFLEVIATISLKVLTRDFFRSKKFQRFNIFEAFFLKQKLTSATQNIEVYLMNLELVYLVQLHIFWNKMNAFH